MSKKHFYSHIVATADISLSIADTHMQNDERVKLIALAEENLHHAILNAVLSQLSSEDKKTFLKHISEENHEESWKFLSKKVKNVEELVTEISLKLKNEMLDDIKKASK